MPSASAPHRSSRTSSPGRFARARKHVAELLQPVAPYPSAAIASLAITCGLDIAISRGHLGASYVAFLTCLVVGLGFALGLVWQASFALFARLPRRVAWVLVPAVTLAVALWFAHSLGSFARLGSQYDRLARLTLVACVTGGLGTGTLLLVLRPGTGAPLGWLGARAWPWRTACAVALVLAAGACAYADATLYIGLYLPAHVALRIATVCTLMLAIALAIGRRLPRAGLRAGLTIAVLFAIPLVALRESDSDSLQAFVTRPWSATVLRVARAAIDLDLDGYSALLGGGDCNDFDSRMNPSAREVPDNGIDDNCAFGDAHRRVVAPSTVPVPKKPSPMNVVLITVDTLRWDRLGIGNTEFGALGRNTMPNVRKWAEHGVSFRRAYTAGGWTSIALSTLSRGIYARRMDWIAYFETSFYRLVRNPVAASLGSGERIAKMFPLAWNDPHEPLSFWLKRRGMRTMAVVDDGFSQMLSSQLGANRGFDSYREINGEPPDDADAFRRAKKRNRNVNAGQSDASTAAGAVMALDSMKGRNERFFLWAHFFGPHTPSTRHANIPYDASSLDKQYDHEVTFVDAQIARVLAAVDALDLPTAVFVTADHGERFFKRYRSHGADLTEDVLHVPLVARVPGWTPGQVDTLVSLIDLAPTILALTGTPGPEDCDGIDLAAVVAGKGPRSRVLLTDTWQYGRDGKNASDLVGAFDGKRKVVFDRHEHSLVAYDQRNPRAKPMRVEGLAVDRLVRATMGYLEESGGSLALER